MCKREREERERERERCKRENVAVEPRGKREKMLKSSVNAQKIVRFNRWLNFKVSKNVKFHPLDQLYKQ